MGIDFLDLVEGTQRIGLVNVLILLVMSGSGYLIIDTLKKTKEEEIRQKQKILAATEENAKTTSNSISEIKEMIFAVHITLTALQASTKESLTFMREIVVNNEKD